MLTNQERYREEYEKQVQLAIKSIVELYYPEEYESLYGDEPTIGNNTFEIVNDLEQVSTEKHNKIYENKSNRADFIEVDKAELVKKLRPI